MRPSVRRCSCDHAGSRYADVMATLSLFQCPFARTISRRSPRLFTSVCISSSSPVLSAEQSGCAPQSMIRRGTPRICGISAPERSNNEHLPFTRRSAGKAIQTSRDLLWATCQDVDKNRRWPEHLIQSRTSAHSTRYRCRRSSIACDRVRARVADVTVPSVRSTPRLRVRLRLTRLGVQKPLPFAIQNYPAGITRECPDVGLCDLPVC